MSRQNQEMLHRQKPPEGGSGGAMGTIPEERQFNRGGGGGGPFIAYSVGSMSTSTRTVCEPDPNDPNHQICKTITERKQLNPSTGKYDTFREEKQITPPAQRGYFQRPINSRNEIPSSQEPSLRGFFSNIKNNFSNWWNRGEGNSGFIGNSNGINQAPVPQNAVVQRNMNNFQNFSAQGDEYDPIREIEAQMFSPFRRMGHPFFHDDPFERMHRDFFNHHDPMASFFAEDPIFGRAHPGPPSDGGNGGFQENSPFSDFPIATFIQGPNGQIAHITPEAIRELKKEVENMEKEERENARFSRKHETTQKKKAPEPEIPHTKHRSKADDKIYDV